MKNNLILFIIIALAAGGGAGFFSGMKYQESRRNQVRGNFVRQFQGGANGQIRGGGAGGRPVVGQIVSIDDKSITVKIQDGTSKIIIVPDGVTINQTTQAAKSDLKAGETIGVFGTDNTDGSVTAQTIQLNPGFRMATGGASPRQ